MAQQTSVEWLENEIYKLYIRENGELPYLYIIQLIHQAEEIHKEEIINANWEACEDSDRAEQYYNKTFKLE